MPLQEKHASSQAGHFSNASTHGGFRILLICADQVQDVQTQAEVKKEMCLSMHLVKEV